MDRSDRDSLVDAYPEGLVRQLLRALNRLSNSSHFIGPNERALFSELADAIRGHRAAGSCVEDTCLALERAYWQLEHWAVDQLHSLGLVKSDNAILEALLARVTKAHHPFLACCERQPPQDVSPMLRGVFQRDLKAVQALAEAPWSALVAACCPSLIDPVTSAGAAGREEGGEEVDWDLKKLLRHAEDWSTHCDAIADFVHRHLLPPFRGAKAFYVDHGPPAALRPVRAFDAFDLDWLEGNGERIEVLMRNTRHFLAGHRAHNALIWGPRGGGKSSLVRGLVERYWNEGLRVIEIAPEDYGFLREICNEVRGRRERFIGFLDNISMERGDRALHHLSRVLEGGLEAMPDNIVFYATSNFKDLVDRQGERVQGLGVMQMEEGAETPTHKGVRPDWYDPQQHQRIDELRALDDRFALKVFVDLPRKNQYESIVLSYARRAGIARPDEEVLRAFSQWSMRHNHDLIGGRTARDFVRYLAQEECSSTGG